MTHFLFFCLEIKCVKLGWLYLYRNSLHDLKIVACKAVYLEWVVGEKSDLSDSEIHKYLCSYGVIPCIIRETKLEVCLNGVKPLILKRICLDLVDKADSSALLAHVQEHASAFLGNGLHGRIELLSAVTLL